MAQKDHKQSEFYEKSPWQMMFLKISFTVEAVGTKYQGNDILISLIASTTALDRKKIILLNKIKVWKGEIIKFKQRIWD